MKRKLLFPLVLLLLLTGGNAWAEKKETLYYGIVTRRFADSTTSIYPEMDKESRPFKYLNPGAPLEITAVYPDWMEVNYNGRIGYIIRKRVDVTAAADPVHTPPYPAVEHYYYAVIDRTVYVKSDKSAESETLSTLTEGARIAIIGMEDGWAKLIYHHQYGYVDTRDLSELLPVASDAETADTQQPLAVFVSFYNNNSDRIKNLAKACEYMSKVMQPGEEMHFNEEVGPFTPGRGYYPAPVLKDGKTTISYGGGSCQVSSTLWDTLIQLPGITVLMRNPHGNNGASYLPHGMDASSGDSEKRLNLIFRNDYSFPIRIDASTHDNALFIAIFKEAQ